MVEVSVGIREIKSHLSAYLRRVKAGQIITITNHGKAVGQIVPIKPLVEERIQSMVATGLADWNGQKLGPYQPVVKNRGERPLSGLVTKDRE
jgi:prevent-host-death family protein